MKKPGFNYAFIIITAAFINMTLSWGVFNVFGVFFQPLTDEFGWSRALTSGAYSASIIIQGLFGILAGRSSDRWGPRAVIMAGTFLMCLGYVLMSLVNSAWHYYLIYGLLIAPGIGCFWSPLVSTVARWFKSGRGLLTGVVCGGVGFGSLVFAPVLTQVISEHGWRNAFVLMGSFIFITSMVSAVFLKSAPEAKSEGSAGSKVLAGRYPADFGIGEAIGTRQFWAVCFIYFCLGVSQVTTMVHIIPHATDLGMSPIQAASILALIGAVSMAGRLIIGFISDRARVKAALLASVFMMLVAMLWLQEAGDLWQFYVFAVIFGLGYGGTSVLQSVFAAELFGLTSLGVIMAFFSSSFSFGAGIGPAASGYIFDVSRSYGVAFLASSLLLGAALVSFSLLTKPAQKKS